MCRYSGLFLLTFALLACGREGQAPEATCYQLAEGTHLPRFFNTPGAINLAYVSAQGENQVLYAQDLADVEKSEKTVLQRGDNWFVNWADFPSVAFLDEGLHGNILFSHTLQYSAAGTYDYDVMYALQDDEGPLFPPRKLHQDTVAAEHGFLSSAPLPGGGLQVTWLDGRYTKVGAGAGAGEETEEHGHGGGAMTLRTKALADSVSVELDHRVCDCCNTATVATDSLLMVAYRDRSEHEIRDIAYVTRPTKGGTWSTPKLVHADNWEISGCPVNGPALASNQRGDIAISWYTGAAERARLQFARYDAAAGRFSPPLLLDDQDPLGRVDLQLAPDGTAYATGLTLKEGSDAAYLTLWVIDPQGQVTREDLAVTSGARSSGFPKIALFQDKLYWARTVLGEAKGKQYVEVCWR